MKEENDNLLKFPKDFLWGVATSAYQIEGDNYNSDWWEWEQKGKTQDKSGKACDYWNLYRKDHDLLENLGVGLFRSSIEWARIEPEEGKFSEEAIKHYRDILQDLKNRKIKTQVTLWWWTSPIWFQKSMDFIIKNLLRFFPNMSKRFQTKWAI
jgi:beta-glucosidase